MIPYFQKLGEELERVWLKHSYDEEVFCQLALDALERKPPMEHVQVTDIVDWVFSPAQTFRQPSQGNYFGEPPVLLFQSSRFYIEALFWLSSTTSIHQHAFSGAFSVLAGSSVHTHWQFAPEHTINSRMVCGRLERVCTEILSPGGTRAIHSGDRLIHQLFHLEVPSVTLVVRTNGDRKHLPQYTYLPPGLAIDFEDRDELRTRRMMLLEGLQQIEELRKYSYSLIATRDLETLYHMFSVLTRRKVERRLLEELYSLAREHHGAVMDLFQQVCREERRTRIIKSLRSKITNPEARFLLALLMLMPDRDAILEAIRLRVPGAEPFSVIETWLAGISGKETIGFDFNDENRLIFRALVEGLSSEDLLQRLRAEFRADSIDAHRERLLEHAKQLAKSDLFGPLLSKSPLREEMPVD